MEVFDSSNEAPGRTDNTAKNLNPLLCTVAKTIKKNPKSDRFSKRLKFWGFLFIFHSKVNH